MVEIHVFLKILFIGKINNVNVSIITVTNYTLLSMSYFVICYRNEENQYGNFTSLSIL